MEVQDDKTKALIDEAPKDETTRLIPTDQVTDPGYTSSQTRPRQPVYAVQGPFRHLNGIGRILFAALGIADVTSIFFLYKSLPKEKRDDQEVFICYVCFLCRGFSLIFMYGLMEWTSTVWPFSLSSLLTVIYHSLSPWGPMISQVSAYAMWLVPMLLYLNYPASWASEFFGRHDRFMSEVKNKKMDTNTYASAALPGTAYVNENVTDEDSFWLQEYGDPTKPAVILIAGMPCGSLSTFAAGLQMSGFFVVLIEYPGTGLGRYQTFTVEEYERRVKKYVTTLQPTPGRKVFLHGHSGGGNMVLYLAAKLPDHVAAVVSSSGVSPKHYMNFNPTRIVGFHPLSFKTKTDSRLIPTFLLSMFMKRQMLSYTGFTSDTATENAFINMGSPVEDLTACTSQEYFHDPTVLERDYFGNGGPGSRADFEETNQEILSRLKKFCDKESGLLFCPSIYAEYVAEFCKADMRGCVSEVKCPVMFFGAKGDPAGDAFESFAEALPNATLRENVMVDMVNPGPGGLHAHLHPVNLCKRHHLTMVRFFRKHESAAV